MLQPLTKKSCSQVDENCMKTRLIMIDAIGSVDSEAAQRILLWYVLRRPRSDEEIEKTFVHLISMTQPIPALVVEIENHCFGQKFEKHGRMSLNSMTCGQLYLFLCTFYNI